MTLATPAAPIFVDDSGRRRRLVRVLGWCLGVLALGYLALVGIALIGSPGFLPLSLPGIGSILPRISAPNIGDAIHGTRRIGDLLPAPAAHHNNGSGNGNRSGSHSAGTTTVHPRPAPTPVATHGVRSHGSPTPQPTASAVPTHGNPSPHGTARATRHPSPHARPTPTSTP